jgi:hypothetical protein
MTVTIRTEYRTDASGKGKITAKGKGKQRTVPYDHSKGVDANHGAAAGALGDVILDSLQQSKMHHPSGRQRWHFDAPENGKRVITLDV